MTATESVDVLVHRALLYGHEDEFLDVTIPFLREGLMRGGRPVVISERAGLVRRRLGRGASRVEFLDAPGWFGAPARTLTAYLASARERWWSRGPLYLVAEPVWRARTRPEAREWGRLESLLNVAFADTPTSLLCAYDVRSLPTEVAEDVGRTHPELIGAGGIRRSARFTDPAVFYAERNRAPLAPPVDPVTSRAFSGGDLAGLRAFVAAEAERHGLPRERRLALVQSVAEVAGHVARNGGGRGSVWIWSPDGSLICDVIDAGTALDDRYLGYFPPTPHRPAGAGMWAVRQLCDLVEIRSGADCSVVRLHMGHGPR
ncbi:sensor histidine kinase [Actinoallomurus rhizosphaericola]|uniref:sensor histidine kinase n=1 Tax=Actinoallomurus rhizosphaericola TaxID=2952536 RepID=UPI0020904C10|nr:sensor histidine kinase [Actinoallomurus rhizosphaericola]MCO5994020.1 sensor histidine kinase [Actinoallomurus rhizosphaericola]